eukprot:jgi/Mesen1/3059/ME000018S02366
MTTLRDRNLFVGSVGIARPLPAYSAYGPSVHGSAEHTRPFAFPAGQVINSRAAMVPSLYPPGVGFVSPGQGIVKKKSFRPVRRPVAPSSKATGSVQNKTSMQIAGGQIKKNRYKPHYQKKKKSDRQVTKVEDGEFRPPRLQDLKRRNRARTRKFFPKLGAQVMPDAPRNTTSFIMRASKLGPSATGASPATPAVVPTPLVSPAPGARQVVEEAKELQVDPYGSMNGCIRLKTPELEESDETDGGVDKCESSGEAEASSGSMGNAELGNHAGTSGRSMHHLYHSMDHSLQRFEMMYSLDGPDAPDVEKNGDRFLRARIEEQENQIAHLEDENLTLRERLYVAEQEIREMKRRAREGSDEFDEAEGFDMGGEEASCAAEASCGGSQAGC